MSKFLKVAGVGIVAWAIFKWSGWSLGTWILLLIWVALIGQMVFGDGDKRCRDDMPPSDKPGYIRSPDGE